MATFDATFTQVQNQTSRGSEIQVSAGKGAIGPTRLATSTTAQTLQRGGVNWVAPAPGYLIVYCDGAIRVAAGEVAATGESPVGHFVPAERMHAISVNRGETVSVIDA